MSGKKVCINSTSSYYTGKEQSPLHFGLSAEGYEINAIMEGFDKELWVVEVRNNKKVWTKKEHINKLTYEKPLITESNDDRTDTTANSSKNLITHDNEPIITSNIEQNMTSINTSKNDEKNKEKESKTIKPTDYTLFITYRIHQMKNTSSDNKKNYDCARYEWKEYKKKPEELKVIMMDAYNFQKTDFKINKK
jgi:hypothetical protein